MPTAPLVTVGGDDLDGAGPAMHPDRAQRAAVSHRGLPFVYTVPSVLNMTTAREPKTVTVLAVDYARFRADLRPTGRRILASAPIVEHGADAYAVTVGPALGDEGASCIDGGPVVDGVCVEHGERACVVSSTRQPRERAVPCQRCRTDTFEISAICRPCLTPIEELLL